MSASEPSAVEGVWRSPGRAQATAARLAVDNGAVAIRAAEGGRELARMELAEAEVSDRVGSIARHVTLPGLGDFETADNDAVDRLFAAHGRPAGMVPRLEAFRPRLVVFAVATVALCIAIYRLAMPALVEFAVWATPPAVSALISQGALLSLDKSMLAPSELPADRRKQLTDGFGSLVALAPEDASARHLRADYHLLFRKGGLIGPNAFALPDGTIVVTDELVALSSDDEMVLGVLAHEIGHVVYAHSLRQIYRAAGVTSLIMLIGGDIGSGTEDLLIQGSALVSLAYSRSAEAQADHFSVELMHKAHRDPAAIARFLELIRDKFGDNGHNDFLSTHPATPERIEETRRYAAQVAAGP